MSLFSGLSEEIKALNSDAKNVANCERAKKLRKKLFAIGLPMTIIGVLGIITCFILFITIGTSGFKGGFSGGFPTGIIAPMVSFLISGIVAGIGSDFLSLGFKIAITGYTNKLIDDAVGNNCPKCGDKVSEDEMFCSKCGFQLRKECTGCKTINSHKDKFCKKCGKEL